MYQLGRTILDVFTISNKILCEKQDNLVFFFYWCDPATDTTSFATLGNYSGDLELLLRSSVTIVGE